MIDKTQFKEVIEDSKAKHLQVGEIAQSIMFGGDTSGELYRKTELQDRPYKTRVMSLFFEDEERVLKHGFTPRAHYLDNELPIRIYVEHNRPELPEYLKNA